MADEDSKVLKPGEIIKPSLTIETAVKLIDKLYGLKGINLKEYVSYDDRNFFFRVDLESEIHNAFIKREDISPAGYMLKVTNSLDSQDGELFHAQTAMILHMHNKGLEVPIPLKNVHGTYQTLEALDDSEDSQEVKEGRFMVRVLKFVPGKTLYDISPWTSSHFYQCGRFAAEVDVALKDFRHAGFETRDSIWFLSSVPKLVDFTSAIQNESNRNLVLDIIKTFTDEVMTIKDQLEKSIIHGDLNEQNLLVRQNEKSGNYEIFSVIDFGDSQFNPLIFELSLAIMYMMTNCTEMHPNEVGGHVLAGYSTLRELPAIEWEILRTCVAARYAQSLTLGAYTYQQDPTNEYVLTTSKTGWIKLNEFWAMPKEELYSKWLSTVDSYRTKQG